MEFQEYDGGLLDGIFQHSVSSPSSVHQATKNGERSNDENKIINEGYELCTSWR